MAKRLILLAHGAGGGSDHPWMDKWATLLDPLGRVVRFDYPFARKNKELDAKRKTDEAAKGPSDDEGGDENGNGQGRRGQRGQRGKQGQRRNQPDPLKELIQAHREAIEDAKKDGDKVVLIGKSMGSRVSCHVSLEDGVAVDGIVCLGYPLQAQGRRVKGTRDEVLRELRSPVMFVQGTRDRMCPIRSLDAIRQDLEVPNYIHVVEGGDHSLIVRKTQLDELGKKQEDLDRAAVDAIKAFLDEHVPVRRASGVGVPPDWLTPRWLLRIATSGFILPGEPAGPFSAPGGTDEPSFVGGRINRLRREVAWFPVTTHRCPISGLRETVRVLHLSDVHVRGEGEWLEQLVRDVAGIEADLVVLTGDVVARGWTEAAVDRFLGALRDARLGAFACMGNWEHWGGAHPDRWRVILARHGIELLIDDARTLGPLHLVGTDDGLSGEPDRQKILSALHPTLPNVVLTHSPAYFPALIDPRVSLVLSGHNHGGQVRVGRFGPLWLPRGWGGYLAGWYSAGATRLFVHRGVGWSVFPVRYRSPPELAMIELLPC